MGTIGKTIVDILDLLLMLSFLLGLFFPIIIHILAELHLRPFYKKLARPKVVGMSCLMVGIPLALFGGMVLYKLKPYDEGCYSYLISGSVLIVIGICALSPKIEKNLRTRSVEGGGRDQQSPINEGVIVFGANFAVKLTVGLYEALFITILVWTGIGYWEVDVTCLAFCLLPVFLWPQTVTLDEQGLSSTHLLWGGKRWMSWADVQELIPDGTRNTITAVSVNGLRVSHTGPHANQTCFESECLRRASRWTQHR